MAALLVAIPGVLCAAPGDLDLAFGNGGMVVSTVTVSGIGGLTVLPDGKLLVLATAVASDGNGALLLARFGSDGTPDAGFGAGGTVVEPLASVFAPGLIVEPDGSLVVAARRCDATQCTNGLRRYGADGQPGATSSVEHFVLSPTDANAVGRQEDGKVIVGGTAGHSPTWVIWLARHGADGTPDATFGTDGVVSETISRHGSVLDSLLVAPGGAILVGVTGSSGESGFSSIRRFSASGVQDAVAPTAAILPMIALGPNGTVTAAGTLTSAEDPVSRIGVERFDADLHGDGTFAGGTAATGPLGTPGAVLVEPDGKVVVAAALGAADDPRFGLVRFTATGTLDAGFGDGGVASPSPAQTGRAAALVRQADGKLVAAGILGTIESGHGPLGIARFLAGDGPGPGGATTTTTAPGAPTTTTTYRSPPGSTTTTTLPSTCTPVGAAACDDGDPCTADTCDGARCGHESATGFAAVTCLCSAVPACTQRGGAGFARRVTRACKLVARAADAGVGSPRLVRHALRVLHAVAVRGTRVARSTTPDPGCTDLLGLVDELRRRTALLLPTRR